MSIKLDEKWDHQYESEDYKKEYYTLRHAALDLRDCGLTEKGIS